MDQGKNVKMTLPSRSFRENFKVNKMENSIYANLDNAANLALNDLKDPWQTRIMVGNPTPVRGILEKILPEVLQNLPKAAGRGQILEGRGQDFFQQFRGMRGWISA